MSDAIVVALIAAGVEVFTVVWTSKKTHKKLDKQQSAANRNDAKQSILQMITEDKVVYCVDHKLPENYKRIHEEYDMYHKEGGNGLMTKKVKEYDEWYASIEKKIG